MSIRPKRGTEAVFYDTFADWDVKDQASALKVLEALHRQKQRETRRAQAGCPTCGRSKEYAGNCIDSFHVPERDLLEIPRPAADEKEGGPAWEDVRAAFPTKDQTR